MNRHTALAFACLTLIGLHVQAAPPDPLEPASVATPAALAQRFAAGLPLPGMPDLDRPVIVRSGTVICRSPGALRNPNVEITMTIGACAVVESAGVRARVHEPRTAHEYVQAYHTQTIRISLPATQLSSATPATGWVDLQSLTNEGTAPLRRTAQKPAPLPQAGDDGNHELGRLILLLMPENGQTSIPWDHRSESAIKWLDAGYVRQKDRLLGEHAVRRGLIRANVMGQQATVLKKGKEELPWTVIYWTSGPEKFGAEKILLEPGGPSEPCFGSLYEGCSFDVLPSLAAAGISATRLCRQRQQGAELSGFTLSHPNRGSIQLRVMDDGGSGGQSTSLELAFNPNPQTLCTIKGR